MRNAIITLTLSTCVCLAACSGGKKSEPQTVESTTQSSETGGKVVGIIYDNPAEKNNNEKKAKQETVSEPYKWDDIVAFSERYLDHSEFNVEPFAEILPEFGLTLDFPRPKINGAIRFVFDYRANPRTGIDPDTGDPLTGIATRSLSISARPGYTEYGNQFKEYFENQILPYYKEKYTLNEKFTHIKDNHYKYVFNVGTPETVKEDGQWTVEWESDKERSGIHIFFSHNFYGSSY